MYSLSTTCQFELHLNNKDKCRVYKYTMGKDIATLQLHKYGHVFELKLRSITFIFSISFSRQMPRPPANAEIVPLESLPEIVEGTEVNLLAMVRKFLQLYIKAQYHFTITFLDLLAAGARTPKSLMDLKKMKQFFFLPASVFALSKYSQIRLLLHVFHFYGYNISVGRENTVAHFNNRAQ